jgi:hypothetical protein
MTESEENWSHPKAVIGIFASMVLIVVIVILLITKVITF